VNKRAAIYIGLGLVLAAMLGCARAARDTTGFATHDTATVNAPLEQTWQAAKAVLREKEFDIYTRDKRGVLVAYSDVHRHLFQPRRVQYTITCESLTADSTRVSVDSVRQVYGVTLLTYPDWHDRKMTDNKPSLAILDAIQSKVAG